VDGCYFSGNKNAALANCGLADVTIRNCVFWRGVTNAGHGVIEVLLTPQNCIVTGNTIANSKSGGNCIFVESGAIPTTTVTTLKFRFYRNRYKSRQL
jgi:hypothetical protein